MSLPGKSSAGKVKTFAAAFVVAAVVAAMLGGVVSAQGNLSARAVGWPPFTTYQIKATLDDTRHTLSGTEVVTYTNRGEEPLNELYFLLAANAEREPNPYIYRLWNDVGYPNGFDSGWTRVTRVALLPKPLSDSEPLDVAMAKMGSVVGAETSFTLEPAGRSLAKYSRADGLLRVPLPEPLTAGESVRLVIDFETRFPERRSEPAVFDGLYVWRFGWFPTERAREQDRWDDGMRYVPGFFDMELTVPADFVVASGADIQEEVAPEPGRSPEGRGATKTYRLIGKSAGRLSMPLVMGRKLEVLAGKFGDTPILVYYQYGSDRMANKILSMAKEILADYSLHYGQYLYDRLVITENSTLGAGMAADGLVTLTEAVWRYWDPTGDAAMNRLLEWFLAHEIGHQWWGIGVRADFLDENWLSEAFAEYLAQGYMDRKYASDGARLVDPDNKRADAVLLRLLTGNPPLREMLEERPYLGAVQAGVDEAPVKRAEEYKFFNSYATTIYNKGYLILRGVEGIIGREKMEAVLRGFFEKHGGGDPVDVTTFVKEASETAGIDLEPYFAQWLYQDGTVDFAVDGFSSRQETVQNDNGEGASGAGERWITTVKVRNNGSFRMPAAVEVTTADGSTETVVWSGQAAAGEVTVTTQARVIKVAIDPERLTPDVDRVNNFFPKQIEWALLDANPLDAYVVRFGPGVVMVEQPGSLVPAPELGVGVGGRDRDDWSWDIYATLEPGSTWNNMIIAKGAQGKVRLGSSATGYGQARFDGQNRLFAEVGTDFRIWTPVDVGLVGGYVEPALTGLLAGGRDFGTDGNPRYYGRVQVARDMTTKLGWAGDAGVKAASDGSVIVHGAANGYVGIVKNLVASITLAANQVVAGTASAGDRPSYILRGFEGAGGASSGGALFASVDVNYPLARNLNLKASDGLVFDGVEARVFGEIGSSWSTTLSTLNWRDIVGEGLKADAGAELVLGVVLDNSAPLGLRFGYAHQLVGGDIHQFGRTYFEVGMWLDRALMGI